VHPYAAAIAAVSIAVATALGWLAYYHPHAYRPLYYLLAGLLFTGMVGANAWSLAITEADTAAHIVILTARDACTELAARQALAENASAAVTSLNPFNRWWLFAYLFAWAYLLFLSYLREMGITPPSPKP